MSIEEVEREALSLTPAARAKLAHDLVLSLAQMNEQEIEALWLAEAARRDQEMDEGRVKGIPGDEVFARIRAREILRLSRRFRLARWEEGVSGQPRRPATMSWKRTNRKQCS
jgi:putative addiction module component (TIGR02574 family)